MNKTEKTQIITKTGRKKKIYYCKLCNYVSSNKTDYFRHLKRKKHKKNAELNAVEIKYGNKKNVIQKKRKILGLDFCVCQRHFKTKSGIWKHKKMRNVADIHRCKKFPNGNKKNSNNR